LKAFSWDSAWWVFNFVANFANLKYSYMIEDIQAVQQKFEADFFTLQPIVEKTALELYESDHELAKRYLSDYSVTHAENLVVKWRELAEFLITKYNDGYVQDSPGRPSEKGYPESWLKDVLSARPEAFELKKWKEETSETELPF
jgi:dipeptidase